MRVEDFSGTDRFEVRRLVGTGTFGLVYEAYDRRHDATVALKLLRAPRNLYRFKQEFRSLVDLAHPNLIALFELLCQEDRWFFTMQFVNGVDFLGRRNGWLDPSAVTRIVPPSTTMQGPSSARDGGTSPARYDRVTPSQPTLTEDDVSASLSATSSTSTVYGHERVGNGQRLPPCRDYGALRDRLRQLGAGLSALHGAGKLHQDIKPSNVLVTADQHVVLLDFGLVLDVDDANHGPAGTPAYMAPEQSPGDRVTPASDWYSVGVMLYQSLTGVLPFRGQTTSDILAAKRTGDPIPPSELVKGIPTDLEQLCMGLLHRDPSMRPDGGEFMARVVPGLTGNDVRATAITAPLMGREAELEALWDGFRSSVESRTMATLVQGESGMGKTALVQRFVRELAAKRPDAVVLAGRCYVQESVPYKALDGVVDALARFLERHPAIVDGHSPADVAALARLFPVLQHVRPFADLARTDVGVTNGQELRGRALRALRDILRKLGDRRHLVVVIDDLQWGDADSAELLIELFRTAQPPRAFLILSYRDSELADNVHLQSLIPDLRKLSDIHVREMLLTHLSVTHVRELALEILGDRATRVLEHEPLAQQPQSPLFALELLRHFSDELTVSSDRLASLDDLMRDRIRRVPPAARHVLELLAIAARPTEAGIVHTATGAGDTATEAAIRLLMDARLIRERWSHEQRLLEPYHDRIAEVAAKDIAPVERVAAHRALAFALEARQVPDAEVLARHFYAAEIFDEAAAYARAAADQASNALAFDRAIRLYRFALDLVRDKATRLSLRISLAEELARAGRGVESAAEFRIASDESTSIQSLELRRRAAEQLLRSGRIDDGVAMIRENLSLYGIANPETTGKAVAATFYHRSLLRIFGFNLRNVRKDDFSPEALTRVDTYFSVALGYGMVDYARGAYFQVHHVKAALEVGEPFRVSRALLLDAAFSAAPGLRYREQTEKVLAEARTVAALHHEPYLDACSALCLGIITSLRGRFRHSYEHCEEADKGFRASSRGVAWELEGANRYGLLALCQLGEYARVLERIDPVITEAHQRGDAFAETNLRLTIGYWSALLADDIEGARRHVAIASTLWVNKGFQTQHYWAKLAEVDIALFLGDFEHAHEVMTSGWTQRVEWTMLKFHQYARVQVCSRRGKAAAAFASRTPKQSTERRRLLQSAARDADLLLREQAMDWALAQSHMTRGMISEVEGNIDRAVYWYVQAETTFAAADMMAHLAAIRRRQGELLGGDHGRSLIDQANAWFVSQATRNPDGMYDLLLPRLST